MRTNLSNAYFSKLANNINLAAEARQVEEEFCLCKNYSMTTKSDKTLIHRLKICPSTLKTILRKKAV